ncbi:hypothetical protein PRZ48_000832 [Zasmidium cellare]|uniref:Uncharacterized protein n=1 Tax=Zasmidium cellare TaxID=395010 RepID=A0ABR0F1Y9_ZASCE|nr:hypothetical protein PRZ48_000832 [Zasmidium cellare]
MSSVMRARPSFELRLTIYELSINPTKSRGLYLSRDVWTRKDREKPWRRFMKLFFVCRRMYDETVDILYKRHELLLFSAHPPLQNRVGCLTTFAHVFQRAQRIRLTLFVTGDLAQDNVLIALMGWLKAVLAERERPLKSLTLEFCAISPTLDCKPTSLLYAAQAFRDVGPTKFVFQCGFSGVGSESAMEALMQHANEKIRKSSRPPVSSEEAFAKYLVAWKRIQPAGLAGQVDEVKRKWLMDGRYVTLSKSLSNRWFDTTFEL